MPGLIDRRQAQVPRQLPLVRPADPVSPGLAGRHARRRQPDLHGARRHRRQPRHRRASIRASAPTSCTSRTARRPTSRRRASARSRSRPNWARAAPAAASCSPTTRRSSRPSSRRPSPFDLDIAKSATNPGEPLVAPRDDGRAVLPLADRGRRRERHALHVRLHVRQVVRRSAGGPRPREAEPGRRHIEVPDQRRAPSRAPRPRNGPVARGTAPAMAPTTR